MSKFKLFSRKPAFDVCRECGVHFDPAIGVDAREFPGLCEEHRKKPREIHNRRATVMRWAAANWEKLETQATAEEAARIASCVAAMQDSLACIGGGRGGIGTIGGLTELHQFGNSYANRLYP